jgi:hypothetical protein
MAEAVTMLRESRRSDRPELKGGEREPTVVSAGSEKMSWAGRISELRYSKQDNREKRRKGRKKRRKRRPGGSSWAVTPPVPGRPA